MNFSSIGAKRYYHHHVSQMSYVLDHEIRVLPSPHSAYPISSLKSSNGGLWCLHPFMSLTVVFEFFFKVLTTIDVSCCCFYYPTCSMSVAQYVSGFFQIVVLAMPNVYAMFLTCVFSLFSLLQTGLLFFPIHCLSLSSLTANAVFTGETKS